MTRAPAAEAPQQADRAVCSLSAATELGVHLAVGHVLGEAFDDFRLRGNRVDRDHVGVNLAHGIGRGTVTGDADDRALDHSFTISSLFLP